MKLKVYNKKIISSIKITTNNTQIYNNIKYVIYIINGLTNLKFDFFTF